MKKNGKNILLRLYVYLLLAKYHEHPFNIETGDMTFREVYENWSEDKCEK